MGIEDALNLHTHWVIDTAPIIYYIEEHPRYLPLADKIFPRLNIAPNSIYAFSSIIALTEVLPHPLRQNKPELAQRYRDFLLKSQNFILFPVDAIIAERAAEIRAQYQYRTPDAIQLATGLEHDATLFITNDKRCVGEAGVNALRISWHIYNSFEEVNRVLEGVQDAAKL